MLERNSLHGWDAGPLSQFTTLSLPLSWVTVCSTETWTRTVSLWGNIALQKHHLEPVWNLYKLYSDLNSGFLETAKDYKILQQLQRYWGCFSVLHFPGGETTATKRRKWDSFLYGSDLQWRDKRNYQLKRGCENWESFSEGPGWWKQRIEKLVERMEASSWVNSFSDWKSYHNPLEKKLLPETTQVSTP